MSLYIVATPIGNLGDITIRAIDTLKSVNLVCAEDTRQSQKLFAKYDIHTPLTSWHAHSNESKLKQIIEKLKDNQEIALISDAGTPGISDPGYKLIQEAIKNNIRVIPIPGATAVITALCASGMQTDKFLYLGFPPTKKGRQTLFNSLKDEQHTVVFYESPHRIKKAISQLRESLGDDRSIVLARELTKIHEEFWRGSLAEAEKYLEQTKICGEFVIILAGG
ncbi:MAG: 16S rRNA (cytidine(1402)-2'-O)-methyltransferase [Patescibacteria group bacterium]|nr:16S rRNA (cytidine(1402)-2'-O)-methyltransferase [Patescibacteria group bacterium]